MAIIRLTCHPKIMISVMKKAVVSPVIIKQISKFESSKFGFETNGYHKDSPKGILSFNLHLLDNWFFTNINGFE
jgi:hypothetical protein